jgi:colanic acid/amylovoran biosynthesis protein
VRILVDQSGYDLLNVGDVAMLQACVARLRAQWPDAEIMVVAHDPERLAAYCPGAIAIGRTLADLPSLRFLPQRQRLAAEQAWKMAAPYSAGRLAHPSRRWPPRTAIGAVLAADLVVASGGGYLTDAFWWHGCGVLSLLALAQRLGKPTAMFGQGIGPMRRRVLRAQARAVLPGLRVLGLREDRVGPGLALSFGVSPDVLAVTGDDALELIEAPGALAGSAALGLNVRISGYAGVDQDAAAAVGQVVLEAAAALEAPIIALPVSRYAAHSDAAAVEVMLRPGHNTAGLVTQDIEAPRALASAAASCRAVVTGSYHAAVFGLAQGVPAVCLTKSSYYDAKFSGLQALFPSCCFVVSLDRPDYPGDLRASIHRAWDLPAPARAAAQDAAERLRGSGRGAYAQLRTAVAGLVLMTAGSQEPTP